MRLKNHGGRCCCCWTVGASKGRLELCYSNWLVAILFVRGEGCLAWGDRKLCHKLIKKILLRFLMTRKIFS